MAYVGGPSGYLPGRKIFLPLGTCCDTHTAIAAVARIVGESDSFGYEAIDMCQECLNKFNSEDKLIEGACDWCGNSNSNLKYERDADEGISGPVYRVCESCSKERSNTSAEQSGHDQSDEPYEEDGPLIDDDDLDFDTDQRD